jgi:hypothetical protein
VRRRTFGAPAGRAESCRAAARRATDRRAEDRPDRFDRRAGLCDLAQARQADRPAADRRGAQRRGSRAGCTGYHDLARRESGALADAYEQRSRFDPDDPVRPCEPTPEQREALRAALAGEPEVRAAYLAEKDVPPHPGAPFCVVPLDRAAKRLRKRLERGGVAAYARSA